MFKFFKKPNYTNWVAVHLYRFDFSTYIIQARMNKDNGLLQFRTDRVNKELTQMTDIDNPFDFAKTLKSLCDSRFKLTLSSEDMKLSLERIQRDRKKRFEPGGVECGGGGEVKLPKDKN